MKYFSYLFLSLPLIGACLISSVEAAAKAAAKMEDTGTTAPIPFYSFNLPWDCLPVIARFLPPDPVVVDAGAFDGQESCKMARLWPHGHIFSFEPLHQLFNRVLANTQSFSNITAYKLALGDHQGQRIMYLSKDHGSVIGQSSSLYPPKEHLIYSSVPFSGTEVVEITTLDAWAEKEHVDKVDLLWLDMQGYELLALKASPKVLSTVSVILTEVEFVEAYEGQPLYHEVKSWLESQGFVLIGGNFTFPKQNHQWFGDALFVRKELLK